MPLLAIGVLAAGFLLGSTHDDTAMAGIIPNEWVASLVGGSYGYHFRINLWCDLTSFLRWQ
jgi:hypothetical protein